MSRHFATAENWVAWFRTMWPFGRRWLVLQGYRSLATHHPSTLADIALRNHVFAPIREPDPHRAAIAEGRRQCALEIFKLAKIDIDRLLEQTEKPRGDRA